ncbi:hypothetical protein J421_5456 (plasmid) [Gemmatirosa kalamazoonensis]|uniref:Uncharacterized protein n=1 Tax=Gemmatirosa kalamazoonensis TaxID=861299 RepID=W0RQJ2_9BACT|nr:AHH domain-containing protein [Gemmatirosa kalamazoonensis]AHG92991.1 hypothetical protein J421_5456 [Gemmatirosa kalamazoonensis]
MEMLESVAPPALGLHDKSCPFCGGEPPKLLHYKTKHGELKDEDQLEKNLAAENDVTSDPAVGPVYPAPGGNQPHDGWVVQENVFEEIEVHIPPAAHHLIPGDAVMAKTQIEQWTCESKGKIKEDIGYNIDGAPNGIWLPHLPHIHWTRFMNKATKTRFSDVFGTWSSLSDYRRKAVGYVIMSETWLQMHYTDHKGSYKYVDDDENYNNEAKTRCNLLANVMTAFHAPKCPDGKDPLDGKYYPPYGLVGRLYGQANWLRRRITGNPRYWSSWVSPLAQEFTHDLMEDHVGLTSRGVVSRK